MNWIELATEAQVAEIKALSSRQPVVVFKHSTRCSISSMAKNRMEKIADTGNAVIYLLDILQQRPLSNQIAETYHVHHESPQALLIVNGECVYEETHNGITAADIEDEISKWQSKIAG